MKPDLEQQRTAFTWIEMVVVIFVLIVLVFSVVLPRLAHSSKVLPYTCLNNLKEIGTAYRLWAGDNGDLFPFQQTVASNGCLNYLINANQGVLCSTNYWLMQNELGQYPRLLLCPTDERTPARNFSTNFDNTHVSYFVGVSATATFPQSIQGGDRNLGPDTFPAPDYGYSPADGKGNDVAVPIAGPVSWSLKMHSNGKPAEAGNILLADGSVQQVSTASFNKNFLRNAPPTTNWPAGHVPATPSIRLVFP
jgi:competence protein ComGC